MDSGSKPATPKRFQYTLVVLTTIVVAGGFFLKEKWPGNQSHILFSPSPGKNIVLLGDQIATGLDQDQSLRLGTYLEKQLGKPIGRLTLDQQTSHLSAIHPDVVILSLSAGAAVAKEDLGQTLAKIREVVKAIHQQSALVVYLEINPPGIGDNWAMAINQLCNELKMLCVDDIYAGFWNHPGLTLEKMQPPGEANEQAALRIAATLKPHFMER